MHVLLNEAHYDMQNVCTTQNSTLYLIHVCDFFYISNAIYIHRQRNRVIIIILMHQMVKLW